MPLVAPNLDDRTFEQLLREARLRIPRYCPDWTDFNDSDPGMAVVQLFAWFTELMLFRFNQVPELTYVKFLQLLNVQPRPQKAAKVVVCFTPSPPNGAVLRRDLQTVPARSRLEVADDGGPVVFETTRPLDLVPYPLDAVQVFDGAAYTDVSATNDTGGEPFRPLGWTPRVGSALYLGFLPPTNLRPAERTAFPDRLVVQVYLPVEPGGRARAVSKPPDAAPAQNLIWEYQSEFDLPPSETRATRAPEMLARWRRLDTLTDDTAAFTREGRVEVRGPGEDILATLGGKPTPDDGPRFWVRCRLADGQPYPPDRVPEVSFVRANAVEAENLATFAEEVLGESDGFPRPADQLFRMRNFPVDSVTLVVEPAGSAAESWEERNDFLSSKADDPHYAVNKATGEVRFGDGRRGRVPPPGALVVAKKYRAGGGESGNVEAGAINSPPPGVVNVDKVTNPRPAAGGTKEETLEELKEYAPHVLRGNDGRAVTKSDYERVAGLVDGVTKAVALPHTHPDFRGMAIPGTVTVVVVPTAAAPGAALDGPQPTQGLLDRVYAELDAVRPLGTELFVAPPRYQPIEVRVEVVRATDVSDTQARDGVRDAIEEYLSPVPRPKPRPAPGLPAPVGRAPADAPPARSPASPRGWPFGEPFVPSRLYAVILGARTPDGRPLVRSVDVLDFTVGGREGQLDTAYPFDPDELPVGRAEVRVKGASREGAA